jgi:lipid-binding SYLF domain-containing protein
MDRRCKLDKEPEMSTVVKSLTGTILAALVLGGSAVLPAPAAAASKEELDAHVQQTVQDLYRKNMVARELASKAIAMLVFPNIIKAGFWFGAEYGEGAMLIGPSTVGYYNIVSASFGLQAGVQDESLALLFMTADALAKFRAGKGWKAGVDGSVAIVTLGTGGAIDTETLQKPVVGFLFNNKGLMANLTLEGSKISRIER